MGGWDIPTVPILYKGKFNSLIELNKFIHEAHAKPSSIGPKKEGIVIRLARSFGSTRI